MRYTTAMMMSARSRLNTGGASNMETSQLLLVVSDGRGLFLEGMETVKAAVRAARDANVFLVFVVLDNPDSRVCLCSNVTTLTHISSYSCHWQYPQIGQRY